MVRIYISFDPADRPLLQELTTHIKVLKREGLIQYSHSEDLEPGSAATTTREYLDQADVILVLVSPNYLASDYCHDVELQRAMERTEEEEARLRKLRLEGERDKEKLARKLRVAPILLRDVPNFTGTIIGKLNPLPADGRPIGSTKNRDAAWASVVQALKKLISPPQR